MMEILKGIDFNDYDRWSFADKVKYLRFLKVELDKKVEKFDHEYRSLSSDLQMKMDHLILEMELEVKK